MKSISLPDSEIPSWIRYYQKRIEEIDTNISLLSSQKDNFNEILNQLERKDIVNKQFFQKQDEEYSLDWSWLKKAEYVIKSKGNIGITTKDIVELIINHFEKGKSLDRDLVMKNISTGLSINNGEDKKFKRFQNEKGENVYVVNE